MVVVGFSWIRRKDSDVQVRKICSLSVFILSCSYRRGGGGHGEEQPQDAVHAGEPTEDGIRSVSQGEMFIFP